MILSRLRAAVTGFNEDHASQMGAALAYYALFSLAPLLVLSVALLSMAYGDQKAQDAVFRQVRDLMDEKAAEGARSLLQNTKVTPSLTGASLVGLASLLFGASRIFTSLRSSLHRIWRIEAAEDGLIWGFVKTYLLASLMVAIACAFVIVLLITSAVMPVVYRKVADRLPGAPYAGPACDLIVSTLLLTGLFTVTFHVLSDSRLRYIQVLFGAFVSALLFTLGKMAIGLYLGYVDLASAYGAAGSIVVFLAWVYFSAQFLFFGAEVVRAGLPEGKA